MHFDSKKKDRDTSSVIGNDKKKKGMYKKTKIENKGSYSKSDNHSFDKKGRNERNRRFADRKNQDQKDRDFNKDVDFRPSFKKHRSKDDKFSDKSTSFAKKRSNTYGAKSEGRSFDRNRDDRKDRDFNREGDFRPSFKKDRSKDDRFSDKSTSFAKKRSNTYGAKSEGRSFDRKRDDRKDRDFNREGDFRPSFKKDRSKDDRFSDRSSFFDRRRPNFSERKDEGKFSRQGSFTKNDKREGDRRDREGRNFDHKDGDRRDRDFKSSFRNERDFKPSFKKDEFKDDQFSSFDERDESERIAKRLARIGIASRREAELMILEGRITVDGRTITSPALNVRRDATLCLDGKKLPQAERTRLWLYHKEKGLVTTTKDPEGRPTVFERLPEDLPRVFSIGRLDINTEGLLLLTNDGGLKRMLELPSVGWARCYRVRAFGTVSQEALDDLKNGIAIEGLFYGPIEAKIEREQGANIWLTLSLREGKNREVKNVLSALGLTVNRLIRVSYGPFQLADLEKGEVKEIKGRVLQEQLGAQLIEKANADFDGPILKAFSSKKVKKMDDDLMDEKNAIPRSRSGNVWFAPGARSYMRLKKFAETSSKDKTLGQKEGRFGSPRFKKSSFKPKDA